MRFLIALCSLLLIHIQLDAQNHFRANQLDGKLTQEYQEARKLIRQGKYKDAEKKLDKILKKHPDFYEASLRKAVMYYDMGTPQKAALIFDEVIQAAPGYDPEMYFAAAINALAIKEEEKAVSYYTSYLEKGQPDDKKRMRINKELKTLKFRIQARKNPQPITLKPLEGHINTGDSEYLPSPSLDGKSMVFTRRIRGQEDLYISYQNETGQWSVATAIEAINTPDNEAAHSISEDGNTIVFTMCNNKTTGFGSCDLYYTQFDGETYTLPVNMGPRINTPAWESQPCLFANGQKILFSSNRKGSLGGSDLWMVQKTSEGKWGAVVNLGSAINTEGQEESPFLHRDGKTLYFRSNGHTGMGGFDLFMSKWDEQNKEWSTPVNLGYPINSEGDEGSLAVDHLGKIAYYASDINSVGATERNLDLVQFDLPPALRPEPVSYLEISVTDEITGRPLEARVIMIDVDANDTLVFALSERGKLLSALPVKKRLLLHISMPSYLLHSEHFDTGENFLVEAAQYKAILMRKPTPADSRPIVLKNIFFETGSAILQAASFAEIQALAAMLKDQAQLHIRIVGHTDNVGDEAANLKLSADRARAVYSQLIDLGIDAGRLSFEGKGEKEPVATNDTPEGKAANRRTEFYIDNPQTK